MKAVFPCKGVIVLNKHDIQKLQSFYQSKLVTSKMSEIYNTTEYMVQVGNLNYLPPKSKIIVDDDNLLTFSQFDSIQDPPIITTKNTNKAQSTEKISNINNKSILEDNILSNPFFTTLKPID